MLLNTIVFALHRWIEIRSVHFLNGDLWFLVFVFFQRIPGKLIFDFLSTRNDDLCIRNELVLIITSKTYEKQFSFLQY